MSRIVKPGDRFRLNPDHPDLSAQVRALALGRVVFTAMPGVWGGGRISSTDQSGVLRDRAFRQDHIIYVGPRKILVILEK